MSSNGLVKKRTSGEAGLGGLLGGYGSQSEEEEAAVDGPVAGPARPGAADVALTAEVAYPRVAESAANPAAAEANGEVGEAEEPRRSHDDGDGGDEYAADVGPARPTEGDLQMGYAAVATPEDEDEEEGGGQDVGPSRPGASEISAAMAYPETMTGRRDDAADLDNEGKESRDVEDLPEMEAPPLVTAAAAAAAAAAALVPRRIHSAPWRFVEDVRIPPPPPGECDQVMPSGDSLQSKVAQWLELKRSGTNINDRLRSSKGFRNPDFVQSVADHFSIDQQGTQFSKEVFDPKGYANEDYYDALATAQRKENDRREKERRERGLDRGVDFASGGHLSSGTAGGAGATAVNSLSVAAAGGDGRGYSIGKQSWSAGAGVGATGLPDRPAAQQHGHSRWGEGAIIRAGAGAAAARAGIDPAAASARAQAVARDAVERAQGAARGGGSGGGGGGAGWGILTDKR
jgi:hypothetical protein